MVRESIGFGIEWVKEGVLARSLRPGYPKKQGIGQAEVDRWLEPIQESGIRSIICLLDDEQLKFYDVTEGLVAYYRKKGFDVVHIPVRDHKSPALSPEESRGVLEAFRGLPKPVLVHCSAGRDRTGAAVRFLSKESAI